MKIELNKNRNMTGLRDKLKVNFENNYVLLFSTFLSEVDPKWTEPIICDTLNRKLDFLLTLAFQIYELKAEKENMGYICNIYSILNIKDIKKTLTYIKKHTPYLNDIKIESFPFRQDRKCKLHLNFPLPLKYVRQYEDVADFLKQNKITMGNFLYNPYVSIVINI